MKKIILKFAMVAPVLLGLNSCHEDQTYYCYLVEENWPDHDTLETYDEAFWFYKKKQKPEDECKVARADLIIENQYNSGYSCSCECGWEDD